MLTSVSPGQTVCVDIDNTLGCGQNGIYGDCGCLPNAPVMEWVEAFIEAGVHVVLWTGGGEAHAREVAREFGLVGRVQTMAKPPFPMTREGVEQHLGVVPVLTLDNDPNEAIDGVSFVEVSDFFGGHEDRVTFRRFQTVAR